MSSRLFACTMFLACAARLTAQSADSTTHVLFVNDEWERYARVLQIGGDLPAYPWSLRAFGPREIELLRPIGETHPWAGRREERTYRRRHYSLTLLPATAQTIYNSDFPFGYNDGPVWAGKGLTSVLGGGIAAQAGPVTAILAPTLFRAENARFAIVTQGRTGPYSFGDPVYPGSIDQPQRFGDGTYQRLDPGNSTIRVDAGVFAAGFSTANQHWGPARDHPLVLGNNAAGFPHVFLGSSRALDLGPVRVHGRIVWGKLFQSEYNDMREVEPFRLATGLVALASLRSVPGLEIGGTRFFHVLWPDALFTLENLMRPLEGVLKESLVSPGNPGGQSDDNQLASLFARWTFRESGFELYGEFAREDHSWNQRDLQLEPDHNSGYMVGMQRAWKESAMRWWVVRAEILNTRVTSLALSRPQGAFYIHAPVRQGHTYMGQVLGSVGAFGGGAAVLALDAYSPRGRWGVSWVRLMRAENRPGQIGVPSGDDADVQHALAVDGIFFRARAALTFELTTVYENNRNFGADALNVRAATGVRLGW